MGNIWFTENKLHSNHNAPHIRKTPWNNVFTLRQPPSLVWKDKASSCWRSSVSLNSWRKKQREQSVLSLCREETKGEQVVMTWRSSKAVGTPHAAAVEQCAASWSGSTHSPNDCNTSNGFFTGHTGKHERCPLLAYFTSNKKQLHKPQYF